MENFQQPNLLGRRRPSLRLLQLATATVCALCLVLTIGMFVGHSRTSDRQAAIGVIGKDASPSPSSRGTAASRRPKPFSRSGMNSVASGLGTDSVRYYDEQSGAAFTTDLRSGHTSTLSDKRLLGFVRTLWVPGKEQVISLFDAKGIREYRSFDYRTGAVATVAKDVQSLALSPDGRSVAYVETADDTTTVSIANFDTQLIRTVLKTRMPSPTIAWPQTEILLLTYHRHDRAGYDMVTISTDGVFKTLLNDRENLEYVLSPDGRRMLFSFYSVGTGIQLAYLDMNAPTEVALGISTSARKCAWQGGNGRIICGVPAGAELSRDVPSEMMATSDDIVTIDIETGTQTKVFGTEPKTPLAVIDPVVTPSGKYLSFLNLFDRKLYSLEL